MSENVVHINIVSLGYDTPCIVLDGYQGFEEHFASFLIFCFDDDCTVPPKRSYTLSQTKRPNSKFPWS